jgi:8-oxo-dGTP pyrophosphatase MutT (NUDIX family)
VEPPFAGAPNDFEPVAFERRLRALAERTPFAFPSEAVPPDFARSSVLICFWRDADDLRVLLTKRAGSLSRHAGQMAFPGGRAEEGEDPITAALRETEEEVGIASEAVEILGRLDDAWSGAGHWLAPIVGWLDEAPRYRPNPAEVEEIHEPRISTLLEPAAYAEESVAFGEERYVNPILRWEGGRVFGLTTDLLIEAMCWGLDVPSSHGPRRLASLAAYLEARGARIEPG